MHLRILNPLPSKKVYIAERILEDAERFL